MHITFEKLRFKNILSTGNVFTEINLSEFRTTIISGSNGGGKSTIIDALVFALFGKPHRKINKAQLLNSINQKDLMVEVEFQTGNTQFMIRRGIKPNIFEIWSDGVLINQDAASKDYQEYLEHNILKMSYKSFTQIVILGSATYVPFMELPQGQRREIIEDLLDIQIFTTMNTLLKEKVAACKTMIDEGKHNVVLLEQKITSARENNENILKLKSLEKDKIKQKIAKAISSIEECTAYISECNSKIESLQATITDKDKVNTKIQALENMKRDLERRSFDLHKGLEVYHDNDNCPTCRQAIDEAFKQTQEQEVSAKTQEIEQAVEKICSDLEKFRDKQKFVEEVDRQISKILSDRGDFDVQIRMLKSSLKDYKSEYEASQQDLQESVDLTKITAYNNELTELHDKLSDLHSHREILGAATLMLKDGGIKTKIVNQYIPVMNKLINEYLAAFELYVDFQLDSSFNETIKSRFRDTFSYSSFSEGEKLKISISIMLTWRAVAKHRNSVSTNLLLMDETLDGAMDGAGVESLIDTLHAMNADDNIFVISHRGSQFQDKFENHLRFEKIKNFSTVTTES